MLKKLLNIISYSLKGYSPLRSCQLYECRHIKLKGYSIEFGAYKNNKKNFNNFFGGKSKFVLSNIYNNYKSKNYIKLDLTKRLKIKNNTFDNIVIFNVLEHLPSTDKVFKEIDRILKNKGNLIGSTPFIYQIHGAPNDYLRFTKDFFYKKFNKKKYKNFTIKPLGNGPFFASYGLISPYLKFFPIIKEIIILTCYLLDKFIQLFVKTNLVEIYPIGYLFIIKK